MDQMVNPFAEQKARSFFERLWRREFPTYLLTEQYRLAAGLHGTGQAKRYHIGDINLYHDRETTFSGFIQLVDLPSSTFGLPD